MNWRLIFRAGAGVGVISAAALWFLSAPQPLREEPVHTADLENGARIFQVGGCASCHAAADAEGEARLVLLGGLRFDTPFGAFVAPNISMHPIEGIGGWSSLDFLNAMLRGVSPDGEHYYPAFPYTSYARMKPEDILDLWAYMRTLPSSDNPNKPHEIGFPFNIRRGLGLWKQLHLSAAPVVSSPDSDPVWLTGQYLVEGPGHCGSCHTPRDLTGGQILSQWLKGAPDPVEKGTIPDLSQASSDFAGWTELDIAEYLSSGFKPDYDTAGGAMVEVIENTAQLSREDRLAIARYIKAIK